MSRLRELWVRALSLLGIGHRDEVLSEELDHHLELLRQEFIDQGLSADDAAAAARRALGSQWHVRETYRRQLRLPSVDAWMQDVRFALRRLRRDRGTTLAAAILLTIGVSTSLLMADVLDRLLVRPPTQVGAPERARRVYSSHDTGSPSALITNNLTVDALKAATSREIRALAPYMTEEFGLGRGVSARHVRVIDYGPEYFDVLQLHPALGLLPSGDRTTPGAAVISYGLWERQFGSDARVIGQPLRLATDTYTIVAVAPSGFRGIDYDPVDVWVPLEGRATAQLGPHWRTSDGYFSLAVICRIREQVDAVTAESSLSAAFQAAPQPRFEDGKQHPIRILLGELPPARVPGGTHDVRVAEWIGVVSLLVLLIACGNVGNLLLVRGLRHAPELALKASFGATRSRLIREILVEAALLASVAGVASLVFAGWARVLAAKELLPPTVLEEGVLTGRSVVIACAICVFSTLLLGIVPALRLTSRQILNPARGFQAAGSRTLDVFIGFQVALSVPPVIAASLFAVSLWQARRVDFGLQTSDVAVLSMNHEELGTPAETHAAHRRIADRLLLLPQVKSAALVQNVLMRSAYATLFKVAGPHSQPSRMLPYANAVDPAYFQVMGQRFVAGRAFTDRENLKNGPPVMVVNEALAKAYWPGQSALGRCAVVGVENKACAEVVGVVANSTVWASFAFIHDPMPQYFLPIEQYAALSPQRAVMVRTNGSPDDLLALLRSQAQTAGASLPFIDVWSFDDVFQPALRPLRLGAQIFGVLGLLGLAIACAGLAAVTAYGVTRRTRELGIRMALGASPGDLTRRTVARTLAAVLIGLAVGALAAYGSGRWVKDLLFEVDPADWRPYAAVAVTLTALASVAAYLPARRAGRVDPMIALRSE